jgi:hypothetical protein
MIGRFQQAATCPVGSGAGDAIGPDIDGGTVVVPMARIARVAFTGRRTPTDFLSLSAGDFRQVIEMTLNQRH